LRKDNETLCNANRIHNLAGKYEKWHSQKWEKIEPGEDPGW
jgi:hypothetical protein